MGQRIIFARGGLKLLQIVSGLDTKQCVRGNVGPQGGWIVRSYIGWRGERNISYKSMETSP